MSLDVVTQVLVHNELDISFVNVVKWCMHCVEVISSQRKVTPDSENKLEMFHQMIPVFLSQAVAQKLCTSERAAQLQTRIDAEWQEVTELVSAIVDIAHNPEFVQLQERVVACCFNGKRKA
jgi:hypothetical protein